MRATKKRQIWMPNLHEVKVTLRGVRRTRRLCTKCLRRVKAAMNLETIKKSNKENTPQVTTIPV